MRFKKADKERIRAEMIAQMERILEAQGFKDTLQRHDSAITLADIALYREARKRKQDAKIPRE